MKPIVFTLLMVLSFGTAADQFVRGHTRSDGTYVAPYHRSSPDSRRYNNYSAKGNSNPYTGEPGYKHNEFSNPPAHNYGRRKY